MHTSILSYDNYDMCTSLRNMRPAVKTCFSRRSAHPHVM